MKLLAIILGLAAVCYAAPQVEFEGRIVGGADAIPHEAPYAIMILHGVITFSFQCGGSLLNANWVLTAAHCMPRTGSMRVAAGKHGVALGEANEQVRDVVESIIHPEYPEGTFQVMPFDIAMVRTATPFVFNAFVQPIALPAQGAVQTGWSTLYGWGNMSNTTVSNFPTVLQRVDKSIMTFQECSAFYSAPPLHVTNLCTGPVNENIDGCNGDSGGPLVQENNGVLEVIGVVSWGPSPCGRGPSVKVHTSPFVNWINSFVN